MDQSAPVAKNGIILRPAARGDAALAGRLVHLSMGDTAELFFASGRMPLDDSIAWLFEQDAGRFGWSTATVAQVDGNAVGLLVSFSGAKLMRLSLAAGKYMFRLLDLKSMRRLLNTLFITGAEREAGSDEYYISNLAVLPGFQGRGIGSRLLTCAEDCAKTAGLKKCSLLVSMHNAGARRLYERFSYRVIRTIRYHAGDGSLDHQRMVKHLDIHPGG